jgi:hypothetical protein
MNPKPISKCQCGGHENIFIEEGAKLEFVNALKVPSI